MYHTAREAWAHMDGLRSGLLRRCERYAELTIRKICLPVGYDRDNQDQSQDYQSAGAAAVNHLTNKLMLALFSPSRPFAKLEAGNNMKATASQLNLTEVQLNDTLAEGERRALAALDTLGQRPKLFNALRHLVVTGNVLLCLKKGALRTIGLRNYVVQRDIEGRVKQIVIREQLRFDELDPEIVALYRERYQDDASVEFFKWIKRVDNSYVMTQWLDNIELTENAYKGKWPLDRIPYLALTWDLADESNYGTGLVEEHMGALESLSVLSEAVVNGAVLGTEYRWMVNPNGITQITDLNNSVNGDALPGLPTDISPTQGGNPNAITVATNTLDRYERHIARSFLMGSSVIRDAERVTQEEVRMTANELETAYGGTYSTLASTLQKPVAVWLFDEVGLPLKESDVTINIVTGLDALSRSEDLTNLRLAMGDLAAFSDLPEQLLRRTKFSEVASYVGQGRNVALHKFLLTDKEDADLQATQAANRVEENVANEAGVAAVTQGQV